MKIYDLFLVTLSVTFGLTSVVVAFQPGASLDLAFTLFIVEFLCISIFFRNINSSAQRMFDRLALLGVPPFGAIVVYHAFRLLLAAGASR